MRWEASAQRSHSSAAVVVLVLAAFRAAGIAHFGAQTAELVSELRIPAHPAGCCPADLGTIAVQANARSHHGHIRVVKTGRRAVFTLLGTTYAGLDTFVKLLMGLTNSPFTGGTRTREK